MNLGKHESDRIACAECEAKAPVGPCAACEVMICADCGVLTKDPSGQRCICLSCARLIATVGDRPRRGPSKQLSAATIAVCIAFALAAIGGLFAISALR